MVPAIYLFDRFDGPLGILSAVASLTHTEELGGEDTIEFDCTAAPEKGSRLLWRDPEDGACTWWCAPTSRSRAPRMCTPSPP